MSKNKAFASAQRDFSEQEKAQAMAGAPLQATGVVGSAGAEGPAGAVCASSPAGARTSRAG